MGQNKGAASGGNDYLRKPFSMEELIVRRHNLMQLTAGLPPAATGPDVRLIGRYCFFPQRQELYLDEQVRTLSHRETQLLGTLAALSPGELERRI